MMPAFSSGTITTCFNDFDLSRPGIEYLIFRTRDAITDPRLKCTAQTLPLLRVIEVLASYFGKTMDWLLRSEYYKKNTFTDNFRAAERLFKIVQSISQHRYV